MTKAFHILVVQITIPCINQHELDAISPCKYTKHKHLERLKFYANILCELLLFKVENIDSI